MAGSAQFYLGEIAYREGNYDEAVKDYNAVLEGFSGNAKAPAAQLHKGLALLKLNKREAGIHELRALIQRHPQTPEAAAGTGKAERHGCADQSALGAKDAAPTKSPATCGAFCWLAVDGRRYFRLDIRASRADLGGRVSDSGSVASGSSTKFSWSMKVGFPVLM